MLGKNENKIHWFKTVGTTLFAKLIAVRMMSCSSAMSNGVKENYHPISIANS